MDQMRCAQCAAISYSAAARLLVERGDRCPQCGGELELTGDITPVGVSGHRMRRREPADAAGGRFEREG
ncbi:MAG TPA: hypothetical protein VF520_17385 [Thermoleophilaceae bacterium]|jgi:uncharacterized protein with PIN domain